MLKTEPWEFNRAEDVLTSPTVYCQDLSHANVNRITLDLV